MLKKIAIVFLLFFSVFSFSQKNKNTIGFVENKGQIVDQNQKENKSVLYLLNTNGLNVQLRKNGFSYDVYEIKTRPVSKKQNQKDKFSLNNFEKQTEIKQKIKFHRIDIDFLNSNSNVKLVSEEKSVDYDNYYNVVHAPNGITNVHKFKKVTYQNIYDKIDVVFFIPEDSTKVVEYNFVVKPGGRISDIQMQFRGAKTELNNNKIKMATRFGDMEETLPMSWIEEENNKKHVSIHYKKIKNNVYGLETSEDVTGKKVIIDPVPIRLWGTLYGDKTNNYYTLGTANNTIDSYGNLYMSGSTSASNSSFATTGAHQTSIPQGIYLCTNGIIVKFDTNGTRLWGTYYGGINYNDIRGIKADSQNNIVITGQTKSLTNISTVGSHQENNQGGSDAYVVKFNDLGIRIWGTYIGGNSDDFAFGLDIDNLNNIYIVGGTSSISGIAYNSNFQSQLFQSISSYGDAFIAKFNSTGTIIWSTYAGGESFESFNAVVVKGNQIAAVGYTRSETNIATNGAFQQYKYPNGQIDGMIYKFSINGNRLWSSYYGGDNIEEILSVEIDDEDNIYIGGETASSSNMTTPGSFQFSNQELYKGFFAKLSTTGVRLWGSYLNDLYVYSIIYKNNSIYVGATGSSSNQNLTNHCSFNRNLNGESLGYIGKFSKNCDLIWGTFLGGDAMNGGFVIDYATKLSIDNSNNIYVSGITSSNNLISDGNSHQQNMLGFLNYYSMKFIENSANVINISSNSPTCIGSTLNLTASGGTSYSWTGPNGFTSNLQNPSISNVNATHSGQYTCNISGTGGCDGSNTITVQIQNTPAPTGNANQNFCTSQNATVANIITNGSNVIWYDSASNTTPLANTTLLTNNTTYYATQTINGCESVNRLAVTINLINTLNATNYSEIICDNLNNNSEIINLTSYNTNLISSTGNSFSYYTSYNNAISQNSNGQITNFGTYNLVLGTNTFYVRIDSPNTCFQVVTLALELVSKPNIPINDIEPLCEGRNILLNAGNNYDSYTWSTGETSQLITITQPGNYSVVVTENHGTTTCTSTKNFTVVNSNAATIQEIISADWTDNNNTITVQLSNNSQGDYEYSLNGIDFQDSNIFNNLEAGEYTVYVRDKNGCGIVSEELYLLMYPKFFTPNGDGYNDYWKIKFSENEPNLTIKIFDRYGKQLKQMGTNSIGWDGKYLGVDLPSTDYWFVVTRENGKELKGHFSLKR